MMLRLILLVLATVFLVSAGGAEEAPRPCLMENATVRCFPPFVVTSANPSEVYLTGDIWDEASANFLRAMRAAPTARTLVLSSSGGNIDPALLVAREVRKRGLRTLVPEGAECLSSCAYIFLAGVERRLEGRLGVHQVANAVRDSVSVQQAFADVFQTMREFGVADGVISLMLSTPPDEIHYLTSEEVAALGVETDSSSRVPTTATMTEPTPFVPFPLDPPGRQALLLEASDDGRTGAVPFTGTVDWTRGKDEAGLPTIVGRASIPARNLRVDILLRKNFDGALPASHLFELNFRVSDSFVGGSIAGVPGVLLKNEEFVQGQPLVGASERVVGNSFLVALSADPEDAKSNRDLLSSRKWMDLALIYATGKRAIVTLELNPKAVELFKSTVMEWAIQTYPLEGVPENVTVRPMTRRSAGTSTQEKFVEVDEETRLATLLRGNGFTQQTEEMMLTVVGGYLQRGRLPPGSGLRMLFGPSRASDVLIPYRLSIYVPKPDGMRRHLVTAALTDRGVYVLSPPPMEVAFPDEASTQTASPRGGISDYEKGPRQRPTIGR